MKHVLITGGAGFIGANLVRVLLDLKYQVSVFDNRSVPTPEYLDGLSVGRINGDIRDRDAVTTAVSTADAIVHLAAQTGVPRSLDTPYLDCETNVLGTLNVLEACRSTGRGRSSPRVVFASSNAPLGRQPPPATEDKAPLPVSPYGASKLAGEGYCLAYHGSWGVPTVVLRFANVYGPYSRHKGSVVATFVKSLLDGRDLAIDGDGRQTRDFIFVGDLVRAIAAALTADVSGELFQIATGVETSILELAMLLTTIAGREPLMRHLDSRPGDIGKNYSNIDKARAILGWTPQIPLADGLRETWDWFSAQERQ